MVELCQTTTSRKSRHFILFWGYVEVPWSRSRLWPGRKLKSTSSPMTPLSASRNVWRRRKAFPLSNKGESYYLQLQIGGGSGHKSKCHLLDYCWWYGGSLQLILINDDVDLFWTGLYLQENRWTMTKLPEITTLREDPCFIWCLPFVVAADLSVSVSDWEILQSEKNIHAAYIDRVPLVSLWWCITIPSPNLWSRVLRVLPVRFYPQCLYSWRTAKLAWV